jgi:mannose/cellobiose epimerase-like protein (N-acyl-D-glucosamine 2-epimerase family)
MGGVAMALFERVRLWTFDEVLPLWATVGVDAPGLGFVERLDSAGRPDAVTFKRMRVQARQIYVFSHAHSLGWAGGLAAAEAGYRFILDYGRLQDGGWARTLSRDGEVLDPTLDLYDQAFVLLALAWLHRATGDPEPIRLAHWTMDAIDARLARADGRGYRSTDPDAVPGGLQNPHMHLLEAVLALFAATGDERWADHASRLGSLFRATLFDPSTGTLAERFDPAWARVRPPVIEPGHHCEWVWLLAHLGRATGRDYQAEAEALLAFALTRGVAVPSGLVWDEVSDGGEVLKASHRLWPQTEMLKGLLARAEFAGRIDGPAIARTVEAIFAGYLTPAPHGCWRDRLDAAGQATPEPIPASSLYHLFLAFCELLRLQPLLDVAP